MLVEGKQLRGASSTAYLVEGLPNLISELLRESVPALSPEQRGGVHVAAVDLPVLVVASKKEPLIWAHDLRELKGRRERRERERERERERGKDDGEGKEERKQRERGTASQ